MNGSEQKQEQIKSTLLRVLGKGIIAQVEEALRSIVMAKEVLDLATRLSHLGMEAQSAAEAEWLKGVEGRERWSQDEWSQVGDVSEQAASLGSTLHVVQFGLIAALQDAEYRLTTFAESGDSTLEQQIALLMQKFPNVLNDCVAAIMVELDDQESTTAMRRIELNRLLSDQQEPQP